MLKFLGIGAQKCGTTWLHRTLSQHPEIEFPGGKEVHFWSKYYKTRDLAWYAALFKNGKALQGDITPAYSFLPPDIIRAIKEWAPPDLRLIYMIRDPRERAWSAARRALERAEMTHEDASDQWFVDHFKSKGSLQRGDYQSCIHNWRMEFSQESLLIVRHEDLISDPVAVANRCLLHIGTDRHLFTEIDRAALQQGQYVGDGIPLRPSLRPVLNELYQPKIRSLAKYLMMNLSEWQE